MNLNFIGKEFDSLAKLEDYINYEYEPKSNIKLGKRNIYFGDLRLDFVNEINTYGFSPFIFESYSDQINDPNIMRFRTKKFNHGLTNYIKLQTRGVIPHSSGQNKKNFGRLKNTKNSKKNLRNSDKVISNIFLVKKNDDSLKKDDKKNFLQKALVGGIKLNISIDEDENKEKDKDKSKENKSSRDKKDQNNNINKDTSTIEEKQIELMQQLIGAKSNQNYLPNILSGSKELNQAKSLKVIYDNKGSINYLNNNNRKILTLRKNMNLFGDKVTNRIFSSINKRNNKQFASTGDLFNSTKNNNSSVINRINKKKETSKRNKDRFLLFEKARPYRYIKGK